MRVFYKSTSSCPAQLPVCHVTSTSRMFVKWLDESRTICCGPPPFMAGACIYRVPCRVTLALTRRSLFPSWLWTSFPWSCALYVKFFSWGWWIFSSASPIGYRYRIRANLLFSTFPHQSQVKGWLFSAPLFSAIQGCCVDMGPEKLV